MRPLVVSLLPRPPHPTRDGSAIRNYHLLDALAGVFRVQALALVPPDADDLPWEFPPSVEGSLIPLPASPWRTIGTVARTLAGEPYTVAKYRAGELDARLAKLLPRERPAWVISHGFHMASAALRAGPAAWIDLPNVESLIWQRTSATAANLPLRVAAAWQTRLIQRRERETLGRADGTSVVSVPDRALAVASGMDRPPLVVPNGVDLNRYSYRESPTDHLIGFVGDLRWRPNTEGVSWFRRTVWPLLRDRVAEARVEILGRGVSEDHRRMTDDRFTFLGDEPDTRSLWQRAAISIVPLLAGGGTRLKILEAAAMGVPVLSTTVGAEGLDLVREREIIVRDDPSAWADELVALLADATRRRDLAAHARARVETDYDWARIGQDFAAHLAARARAGKG